MTHPGTQPLTSQRLLLRPFTLDDVADMYQNWANSDTVTQYSDWHTHKNEMETYQIVKHWVAQYDDPTFYQWCMVEKATNQPIGTMTAFNVSEDGDSAEVGYAIGEAWWNQGLATEGALLMIAFLFSSTPITTLVGKHHPDNLASGRVLKKLGFQSKGNIVKRTKEGDYVVMPTYQLQQKRQ